MTTHPSPPTSRSTGVPPWLWAIPVVSCCLLGFVPPLVVAVKARTRSSGLWAAGFAVTWLLGFLLVGLQPEDSDNLSTNLGAGLVVVSAVGGLAYAVVVGSQLDWSRPTPAPAQPTPFVAAPDPNQRAVADVMRARRKREEAVALAARDPLMARDLRIGRPDLPRHYDDGGLVDVNSAPAEVLVTWLAVTSEEATAIVGAREHLGRFLQPQDLLSLDGLPVDTFDRIRERVVCL